MKLLKAASNSRMPRLADAPFLARSVREQCLGAWCPRFTSVLWTLTSVFLLPRFFLLRNKLRTENWELTTDFPLCSFFSRGNKTGDGACTLNFSPFLPAVTGLSCFWA